MIYESPAGNLKNLVNCNVAEHLRNSEYVAKYPNVPVYIDSKTEESVTASECINLIGKVHTTLQQRYDIQYDDVVCLFSPNHIYYSSVQHGIASCGGVCTPANAMYQPSELAHQLNVSEAKLVVTVPESEATVTQALKEINSRANVVFIRDLINQAKRADYQTPVHIPDAAKKHLLYCFSSGTSGVPKGVITTHQNMTSNLQQVEHISGENFRPEEEMASAGYLPMSHMYGLAQYSMFSLYRASTVVVFGKFDFEDLLKAIVKYRISHIAAVPPIVLLFAKSPLVEKYPEVKQIVQSMSSGAAPLSSELSTSASTRVNNMKIVQGYGLTETSPATHSAALNIDGYTSGSIGWVIPNVQARIVDLDTGTDAERGELWLKGPNVFAGYLKMPLSAAFNSEGWFPTGDIATVDKTGQFYIVDRAKELIKVKGLQVAPAELEALLLEHPGVTDAAVIGIWDEEQSSEFPRAFVSLTSGQDVVQVKQWLDAKVSSHKQLRGGVVVVDVVPKSPSGKILRRALKERKNDTVHGLKKSSKI